MTKEELVKEADNYFDEKCMHSYADTEEQLKEDVVKGYLAGAEPREKQNIKLDKVDDKTAYENLLVKYAELDMKRKAERQIFQGIVEKKNEQLTKAKDHIKKLLDCLKQDTNDPQTNYYVCQYMDKAEQFLKEIEK